MSKLYTGDIGTVITINCGENISSATGTKFKVRKPDGTKAEWIASIHDSNYLQYTTIANDFDQVGIYTLQAHLTISGWTGSGESFDFTIHQAYK